MTGRSSGNMSDKGHIVYGKKEIKILKDGGILRAAAK
jgi:hypothetical protein